MPTAKRCAQLIERHNAARDGSRSPGRRLGAPGRRARGGRGGEPTGRVATVSGGGPTREAVGGPAPGATWSAPAWCWPPRPSSPRSGPLAEFADRGGRLQPGAGHLARRRGRAVRGAGCSAPGGRCGDSGSRSPLRALPPRDRWSMARCRGRQHDPQPERVHRLPARIGITLSLLIFYLYPAFVALASVLWFGERLDGLRWSALGMSMVGIVLVVAGAGQTRRASTCWASGWHCSARWARPST